MVDSKLLVPELNEAETMDAETARFEELLLQVRTDPDSWVPRYLVLFVCFPEMGLQFPECIRETTRSTGIVV